MIVRNAEIARALVLSPRTVEVTCAAGPEGVFEWAPERGLREFRELRELREMKRMDHWRMERHGRHGRVVRRFHAD